MSIADFTAEKMTSYIRGGMDAETAAEFTRGELRAVYNGNHYSRDTAGQWQKTPLLETLDAATAEAKGEAAIAALLSGYNGNEYENGIGEVCENPPEYNTEPAAPMGEAVNTAPDGNGKKTARRGIDALRHYTEAGIKLMPCVLDGNRYRPIVGNKNRAKTETADIGTIENYMKGGQLWTGYNADKSDRREPVTLFRFMPNEYHLVTMDIDCGHSNGINGIESFYQWLEAEGFYTKKQLPSYLRDFTQNQCYATTPSGGLHLYYKAAEPETYETLSALAAEGKLEKNLAPNVELFFNKSFTAAGSAKQNGDYVLYGNLTDALEFPSIILRRVKKTPKPQSASSAPMRAAADRPERYPQTYTKTNLDLLKPRLLDYLKARGITPNAEGFISCLCHADGNHWNMKVHAENLYCYSCNTSLDIFGAAAILENIGTDKRDFPKAVEAVKRAIGV